MPCAIRNMGRTFFCKFFAHMLFQMLAKNKKLRIFQIALFFKLLCALLESVVVCLCFVSICIVYITLFNTHELLL